MANIHSQKKRIVRAERERLENRRYTSTIKTYFRRLQAAVEGGDTDTADAEHRQLVRTIDKAVKRGALHRNAGARKKSRAAKIRAGARAPKKAPRGEDRRGPRRRVARPPVRASRRGRCGGQPAAIASIARSAAVS